MDTTWQNYLALKAQRPWEFENNGPLEIEFDAEIVRRYEETNQTKIGVIYQSPYSILVVDLIRDGPGTWYPYERILPATVHGGGIVAAVFCKERFVLLNQYRHALRQNQLSFPRGYGEPGLSDEENLRKELKEELGAAVTETERLGDIVADSGISGQRVTAFFCHVEEVALHNGHEGIIDLKFLTGRELQTMIGNGAIQDGFTLSAASLLQSKKSELF